MVVYCCVPSCGVVGKSQNLSMHNFTKDPKLQEVWLRRINSDTIKFGQIPKPIPITSTTKVSMAYADSIHSQILGEAPKTAVLRHYLRQ